MKTATKETIAAILPILGGIASARVRRLPLAPELYSASALEATKSAFARTCRIETRHLAGAQVLDLDPLGDESEDSSRIVGEVLNHLLVLSMRRRHDRPG
jgi:hypothetical protein